MKQKTITVAELEQMLAAEPDEEVSEGNDGRKATASYDVETATLTVVFPCRRVSATTPVTIKGNITLASVPRDMVVRGLGGYAALKVTGSVYIPCWRVPKSWRPSIDPDNVPSQPTGWRIEPDGYLTARDMGLLDGTPATPTIKEKSPKRQ